MCVDVCVGVCVCVHVCVCVSVCACMYMCVCVRVCVCMRACAVRVPASVRMRACVCACTAMRTVHSGQPCPYNTPKDEITGMLVFFEASYKFVVVSVK